MKVFAALILMTLSTIAFSDEAITFGKAPITSPSETIMLNKAESAKAKQDYAALIEKVKNSREVLIAGKTEFNVRKAAIRESRTINDCSTGGVVEKFDCKIMMDKLVNYVVADIMK